jgi:hypothetical protein
MVHPDAKKLLGGKERQWSLLGDAGKWDSRDNNNSLSGRRVLKNSNIVKEAVLWIRIRKDPKFLAGSGSE